MLALMNKLLFLSDKFDIKEFRSVFSKTIKVFILYHNKVIFNVKHGTTQCVCPID